MKVYDIIYKTADKKSKTIECSKYSLEKYIKQFIEEKSEIMCIVAHKNKRKEKNRKK